MQNTKQKRDDIYAQKSDACHNQDEISHKDGKETVGFMSMMNDILANVFEVFSIVLNCDDSFRISGFLARDVG